MGERYDEWRGRLAKVIRRAQVEEVASADFDADLAAQELVALIDGTDATLNSGPCNTRPLRLSTSTGSACSPVTASITTMVLPSGGKCLFPHATNAHSTGRKSRPRSVSTYSYRGGFSL